MKILTLNTHSHMETEDKQDIFVSAVKKELPDIIALQEVNQTIDKEKVIPSGKFYKPLYGSRIKEDNYAKSVTGKLLDDGLCYYWTWLKIKKGFDKFEEGQAFLSRYPIEEIDEILLSNTDDFDNWKKRMALGIRIYDTWFYNVHMGWFEDEEEPFSSHFEKLCTALCHKENVFLMGDFNCNAESDGYKLVLSSGWLDCFKEAKEKDDGITVKGKIAGWEMSGDKRIDYVFSKKKIKIKSSKVVFNGMNYPVVSDHFGVLTEICEVF